MKMEHACELFTDCLPRRLPARSDDFRTASRGYTLLVAATCITQWRAGWATAKPLTLRATLLLSAACLVALLCVRSAKGLLTPPFFVFLDRHGEFFTISTRFRTSWLHVVCVGDTTDALFTSRWRRRAAIERRTRAARGGGGGWRRGRRWPGARRRRRRPAVGGMRAAVPGAALLAAADAALAALLVAPCVVATWRGSWGLLDAARLPWWASLGAGQAGQLLAALLQPAGALPAAGPALWAALLAARLYTAALAGCCVAAWRGAWMLLDEHGGGDDVAHVAASAGASVAALAALRSLRNVAAPPCALATDHIDAYFVVPTLFRLDRSQHGVLWVLDCAFSVLVVGNLIVFTWRGVWTLLDLYLYPDDQLWSAIASLVLGYGVVLVAFALQLPLSLAVGRLQGSWRLLVADLYHLVSFFGTVNVWRGVWNVLEIFLLEEYPELGCWVCATLPLLLLMLLGCGNSVLVRGVFIDGEEPGGRCIIFPCKYLRAYLQDRKQKKREKRRQQLAEQMVNSANHATSLPTFVNPPETTL
ncbi:uncharacterized protein LOC124803366 [Schistocerca piceifrons]|uniref:uncharacterized protein LOC124803366 n=1 Tax=Schistocerca piceifrons TaxID=274613 RepID=UPI001F5EECEB|nr:uncharacterized protein LOC124803366 [Schistocerca piceifrons]